MDSASVSAICLPKIQDQITVRNAAPQRDELLQSTLYKTMVSWAGTAAIRRFPSIGRRAQWTYHFVCYF